MASRIGSRTVRDATRFTSTVPHATSKSTASISASSGRGAAASKNATAGAAAPPTPPKPSSPSSRIPGETPEQRVRRLRQAHIAAQKAQISQTDRIIDASRRFLDVAHRWTVGGIVIFTAVAGVVSVYSVWDMLQYNRARRAEWVQAQQKLEADSLAAARVAYLRGDATEEQILLVEEANREAQEKGTKLPPLLSPPEHRTHFEERVKPNFSSKAATAAASISDDGGSHTGSSKPAEGRGILGVVSGFFGGSQTSTTPSSPAGNESSATTLSAETDASVGAAAAGIGPANEARVQSVWEREKQNQIRGGSLDQLGLETGTSKPTSDKKSWWPW